MEFLMLNFWKSNIYCLFLKMWIWYHYPLRNLHHHYQQMLFISPKRWRKPQIWALEQKELNFFGSYWLQINNLCALISIIFIVFTNKNRFVIDLSTNLPFSEEGIKTFKKRLQIAESHGKFNCRFALLIAAGKVHVCVWAGWMGFLWHGLPQ